MVRLRVERRLPCPTGSFAIREDAEGLPRLEEKLTGWAMSEAGKDVVRSVVLETTPDHLFKSDPLAGLIR